MSEPQDIKVCVKCGDPRPAADYYARKSGRRDSTCKTCRRRVNRKTGKKWRRENPELARRRNKIWNATGGAKESKRRYRERKSQTAEFKDRARVRNVVTHAIRSGDLSPEPCEKCGSEPAQAHHDSYLPGRELDVRWLCSKHHGEEHRCG